VVKERMEIISELTTLFIFCLGFITLIEYFYHIIRDRIRKKHHSHNSTGLAGCPVEFDKRKEGEGGFSHTGNGASHLLAFLLITFSLSVFIINITVV